MSANHPYRTPVYLPRTLLTVYYFGFVALGIAAAIAGSPTLNLLNPDGLTTIWGIGSVIGGGIAFTGSLTEKWESIERWGSIILMATVTFYVVDALVLVIQNDHAGSRATFTIIVILFSLLPGYRSWYLIQRTGLNTRVGR